MKIEISDGHLPWFDQHRFQGSLQWNTTLKSHHFFFFQKTCRWNWHLKSSIVFFFFLYHQEICIVLSNQRVFPYVIAFGKCQDVRNVIYIIHVNSVLTVFGEKHLECFFLLLWWHQSHIMLKHLYIG